MILTAETIHTVLTYIASAGTIFDQFIDNIIAPNYEQKPELISELAVSFLSNEESVNKAIRGNYFQYYFINAVKNQVHSKTSSFHKNVRRTREQFSEPLGTWALSIPDDEQELRDKELIEEKYNMLNEILEDTNVSWFEKEIYDLYFNKNYTYRQIEAETNIDHCLAWVTVDKIKKRIKKQINNSDIY